MNIVRIYAGLGNQIFQYAFGRSMALNGIEVHYDLSWFKMPANPPRPFALNRFRTSIIAEDFRKQKTIHETDPMGYTFVPEYLTTENANFFGYWQHQKYVEKVLPILKQEFRLLPFLYGEKYLELKEKITLEESVGIHVRRGDYLTKGHVLLPIEYYKEAIRKVNGKLFIFSDDIEWCKEQFPSTSIFVREVDFLSFDLMRRCTHKIIANSTFSLWTAMLSDEPGRVIIAPRRWRLRDDQEEKINEQKFIPEHWIRI